MRTLKTIALSLLLAFTASSGMADTKNINASTFTCISEMTPVRDFFVGNINGKLEDTLKVANSKNGGVYPPGTIIQLLPTEAMIKRAKGFNKKTNDWEFFELKLSKKGTVINKRGFEEVVNRFGGNCLECHQKAEAKWDLICEKDHGCDPLPLTPVMVKAIQKTDPRCKPVKLTKEEIQGLKDLREALSK